MKAVTAHGLKIAYEPAGDGPPLVLLHGFLADSRAWRPQIRGLAGSLIPGLFTPAAAAETRAGYEAIMLDFHPSGFRTMSHAVADSDTRAILATYRRRSQLPAGSADRSFAHGACKQRRAP